MALESDINTALMSEKMRNELEVDFLAFLKGFFLLLGSNLGIIPPSVCSN